MVKLYDITNWNAQPWYNTGGTRAKKYVQSPEGKFYYFKQSESKGEKDYKYEFWSEIIAYHLGEMLGFNMLRYDIAIDGNKIGCLSESMIDRQNEELIEGGKYLNAFDNTFSYEEKKPGEKYNFELIENAFEALKLTGYLPKLLEVLVFDAIISNGDRHQENWAFIATHNPISKSVAEIEYNFEENNLEGSPKWLKMFIKYLYFDKKTKELRPELKKAKLLLNKDIKFSPIYDSGSSLCREATSSKVINLLHDNKELDAYINRGKSEIHWKNKKVTHFDFVNNLKFNYESQINAIIDRVKNHYNSKKFEDVLKSIDITVPEMFEEYKIPVERKELILKLVTLRIERL